MSKSINQKFKKNIMVLTIILTVVFLIINISLYVINNNYLINKVEEENSSFLLITTHIINENDVEIALEYVEHYTHIHQVDIEVLDEDRSMLFSSNIAHLYTSQYQIETMKGTFTIFIDNTDSVTVNSIESNTIYVNVSLLIIYLLALIILLRNNRLYSKEIDQDINNVLKLINSEMGDKSEFNHIEFEHIHGVITTYLESIDLLTEQKSMNMKGLAHDIKTPLTIIYSYFERVLKNETLSEKITASTFKAAVRINDLLNDIIEENLKQDNKVIDVSSILSSKIDEYTPIFNNKKIVMNHSIPGKLTVNWTEKDFVRVIDNVISNAYYYSKPNSDFSLNVRNEEKIYIEVVSEPMNLNDIDTKNIFNKGFRGTSSATQNTYGKGFGLYLCRLLLHSVEGTINIDIINENVKFTIIL